MDDLTGKHIRGYELKEQIGQGGFGAVYRATQAAVGRDVAIKVILPHYANDPDFIRSFEAEAEMVARLEHMNIMPLYDYWREPDGAYLVTRYLRGGSLRDRIADKGALSAQEAVLLVDQICAALNVAHRRGVIHRDIKPDNILLDDDGNAFLGDFGISIETDTSNTAELAKMIGTPAYLAPEQFLLEKVTPQSDIYSFGIVIFEALTGIRPFGEASSPIQLMQMAVNDPVPPVRDFRPDLPYPVEKVVFRATAKDPNRRFANALSLAKEFRQAMATELEAFDTADINADELEMTNDLADHYRVFDSQRTMTPPDSSDVGGDYIANPYKGLRAFQEADADDFFGRNDLIDQLLIRLREPSATARFLAVVGPSGSGKSSVVKAGIVPALRNGALPNSENAFIIEMFPSTHPFEELEAALLRIAINPPASLLEQLQSDERGFIRSVKRVLPGDENAELVLIIDQFEELFTLVEDADTRQAFVDCLLAAVEDTHSRIRIIVTLRADFYHRPLLYENLGHLIRQRTEVVLPLSTSELEQAIIQPAKSVGLSLESGLVNAIVQDVGQEPGSLPLLQYALTELFERREGRLMTLKAYRDSGGVLGALARRADELFDELDTDAQAVVRQLFLRLVTLGEGVEDTRRRVRRSEIAIPHVEISRLDAVIDSFGKHRLLTFDRDPVTREPTIEVAHEALIRTWSRLREWIADNRDDLRVHRRLTLAASEWDEKGRDTSYLAGGTRLTELESWAMDTGLALNATEQAFLDASLQHRDHLLRQKEAQAAHELVLQRRAVNRARFLAIIMGIGIAVSWFFLTFTIRLQRDTRSINNELDRQISTSEQREVEAISARETAVAEAEIRGTAQSEAEAASTAVIAANLDVAEAQTSVAVIEQSATPLVSTVEYSETLVAEAAETLDALVVQSEQQASIIESQRLAGEASSALQDGRFETAKLLSIRALNEAYSPLADNVLVESMDIAFVQHILTGHAASVRSAVYSPDAQTILTSSDDGNLRLWDATTGETLHVFEGLAGRATFSPDGIRIAVTVNDKLHLINALTFETLHVSDDHTDQIYGTAFSPDGLTLLTGSGDNTARLWDVETGQTIHILEGHTGRITAVAFSPDGQTLLTGSQDNTARLWDIETGETLHTFGDDPNVGDFPDDSPSLLNTFKVAFAPDGQTVIAGGYDSNVYVWDIETGQLRQSISRVGNNLFFSPDGQIVASMIGFSHVSLWNLSTGNHLHNLNVIGGQLSSIAFSADGLSLWTFDRDSTQLWAVATGELLLNIDDPTLAIAPDEGTILTQNLDGVLRQWRIGGDSRHRLAGHTDQIFDVAYLPDSDTILTASADGTARLWDIETGETLQHFEGHTDPLTSIAVSPDGQKMLTGSVDDTARLWDLQTGQTLHILEGHSNWILGVAFAPDGRTALTSSTDTTRIWDVETGQRIQTLRGDYVGNSVFSPDGNSILSPSIGNTAWILDVETGALQQVIIGHTNLVVDVAFSTDGRMVLTGDYGGTARLWDAVSGETIHVLAGHTDSISTVAISPNNQTILTSSIDGTVRLWDVETGQTLHILEGYTRFAPEIAYSDNGEKVVLGNVEGTTRLWNVETGDVIRVMQGHTSFINDVTFTLDGQYVFTASSDGTARIWETDYRDFVAYACTRMFRDFTPEERAEFGLDDSPTCPQFATE